MSVVSTGESKYKLLADVKKKKKAAYTFLAKILLINPDIQKPRLSDTFLGVSAFSSLTDVVLIYFIF